MNILPVSNIINVTISNTPSGLTTKNVNSVALFSDETPNNLNAFGIYISASQVAADYGTDSVTAQMANAVFAQAPNLLTGGGRLVILPLQLASSATPGTMSTADISANLASLIAIAAGDLKVTIDGQALNLTGINLTGCVTFDDIATVLQGLLQDVTVTAIAATGIEMTSKKVGTASTVTIGAVAGGMGTALNGAGFFNSAASVSVAGSNSGGETILAAIQRTGGAVGYVGVMTSLNLEDDAIETAAAGIEAQDRIFLHHASSTQDILGIATTIQQASERKTRIIIHTDSQATANLCKAAYAGRAFSVDFAGSDTSITMNLKELETISPDTGISETLYQEALVAGCDLYVSFDGVPSVVSTGGNDYFDNQYMNLALKFNLESAGFNFLRQTTTKVPQTEQGMNGLKSAYSNVLNEFVVNGSIAPGSWTSSDTFGDPVIFKQNITNRGFYIYSIPIADQNSSDRDARKAPLCQIAVKRAGAIHDSDVLVIIND